MPKRIILVFCVYCTIADRNELNKTITMIKNLLTFVALSAATIFTANAQTEASAVEGKRQLMFSSTDQSEPYRIPAIATMSNGEVIAVADHRPDGEDVGGKSGILGIGSSVYDVDIYAKIGTANDDGTYSWTPSASHPASSTTGRVVDGKSTSDGVGFGDAALVADRESGKVLIMCVGAKISFWNTSTSSVYKCFRITSDNYGDSWNAPVEITNLRGSNNIFTGSDNVNAMFFASGRLLQSKKKATGANYCRVYGALLVKVGSTDYNYVVYSDDFGESWNLLGTKGKPVVSSANEAKLEELPNGDIVLSSRTSGGRNFNLFTYKANGFDNASGSWKTAESTNFGNSSMGAGADTNGEILLYPAVDGNGDRVNILLQSLPTGSSREKVYVYYKAFPATKTSWAVSDFTSGWTLGLKVDDGASAYSTMTILPDGNIGFMYEDDYSTSSGAGGGSSNIYFLPLTLSEITGGKYSAPATEEPEAPAVAVETPTFSIAGGEVEEGTTVTISCATEGATIYYTTDGNEPTTASAVYGGAIVVDKAMTIKAMAAKEGNYTDSEVVSATFTIKAREVVATPVISPAGGEVAAGTIVTISCATSGATVYYTTDGNEPTTASAVYSGAIVVDKDMTIKAFAAKDGYYTNSAVATATFTIKEVVVEPEVTEYPVTPVSGLIGGTTYYLATFSANENTVAPAGVSVFYVKSVSSDEVALSRVSSGKTIPAGEGVILMASSASAFNMTSTTDESNVADFSDNCLAATLDVVDFTFNVDNCYALAVKGSGELKDQFAFCKVAAGTTLSGYNNRAYLGLSASGASFSNNVRVSFDGVTGIESSVEEFQEQVIYDICGRRVHEMKPGNIYIVNGKKVLKK